MDVARIIEEMGGFLTNDHFVYSSGKHGAIYINKNELLLHASLVGEICEKFAERFKGEEIDIVVGPAVGGIVLAQWTAHHLSMLQNREVLSVFAEKGLEKAFSFKRGYDQLIADKRILIVDDLVNSSGTARNVIKAVQALGGEIVGLSVMINRNPREISADSFDGVPFVPLCEVDVTAYDASDCPMCEKRIPVNTTVGHGRKFLESQGK